MRDPCPLRLGRKGRIPISIMPMGVSMCFLLGLLPQPVAAPRLPLTVTSPDGAVAVRFFTRGEGGTQVPAYRVDYRGKPVLLDPSLGLTIETAGRFGAGFEVENLREDSHSGAWKPLYGERHLIPDNYREATTGLAGSGGGSSSRCRDVEWLRWSNGAAARRICSGPRCRNL